MRKYIVKPISDIIEYYDKLKDGKTVTIFITKKNYHFHPTLKLEFDDVSKGEDGFIQQHQIDAIHNMLPILSKQDIIIVGCDAGISRSPAVALAITDLLKDYEEGDEMMKYYPYLNEDIYSAIVGKKRGKKYVWKI